MHTQKIDFKGENNPFYGKTHSQNTKDKISKSRIGKGGLFGEDNPMYGSHINAGEKNPMYGKTGFRHPNSKMFLVKYKNGEEEFMTSKQCEIKFGIGFSRVRMYDEAIISYKKIDKNYIYEGTIIKRVK